jgi:N-acetylglucosaminyldiphosphoundecaprenol N-acetyl-beta-D-mannosaminyltransferase
MNPAHTKPESGTPSRSSNHISGEHDELSATNSALSISGVRIDVVDPATAIKLTLSSGRGGIHLCNAYTLSLAYTDEPLREALGRAKFNFPDGTPLVWLARFAGIRGTRQRVYGPDLMAGCLDQGRSVGARHFLYGTDRSTLTSLEDAIHGRYDGLAIAGSEAPPFRAVSDAELASTADRIRASHASIVWVATGTPRQDFVVERLATLLDIPVVAVGAAFDFHAGRKRQAPRWIQRSGLEWLFRLCLEPRRLWRRYLIGNIVFIWAAARTCQTVSDRDSSIEEAT